MIQNLFCCIILHAFFLKSSVVYACGRYEFFLWDDLPEEIQDAAAKLNYDVDTWDNIGTNAIESVALSDLLAGIVVGRNKDGPIEFKFGDEQIEALKTLDLYDDQHPQPEMCWDYLVNHYQGYSWSELMEPILNPFGNDLSEALEILGWNQEMWDSMSGEGDIPESDCKNWWDLDPNEQWALTSLGWTGMKWMSYPLGNFHLFVLNVSKL